MPPTAAEVRAQLDDGGWLKTGAVAVLSGVSRFTVDDWLNAGKIRYRKTVGGRRECVPFYDPAHPQRPMARRPGNGLTALLMVMASLCIGLAAVVSVVGALSMGVFTLLG